MEKIDTINITFHVLKVCLLVYSFVIIDIIMPLCTGIFDIYQPLSLDVLSGDIWKLNKTDFLNFIFYEKC